MMRRPWPYGVPIVVYILHATLYRSWLIDDALISVAYARTLTQGGGVAQAVGAPQVEGVSNPLWTLLLAGLRLAGLTDRGHVLAGVSDYVWTAKILGLGLFVGTLVLIGRIVRVVVPASRAPWAVLVSGLVIALNPAYVIWSVSGLENGLYGALVAALAAVLTVSIGNGTHLRWMVAVGAGLLAVTAALTRPDGAIFAAAYPLVALGLIRRGTVTRTIGCVAASSAAFLLPFGAFLLWRWRVFGLLVPNTAVAKAQGLPDGHKLASAALDTLRMTGYGVTIVALVGAVIFLMQAIIFVIPGLGQRAGLLAGPPPRTWAGIVVPVLLAAAAFLVLERDWMGEYRFATPFVVLSAVMFVLVIDAWSRPPARRRGVAVGRAAVAVAGTVALVSLGWSSVVRASAFARDPVVPGCLVADRYGRTFNWYAQELGIDPTGASVLLPDLGGTLLTSRLNVVDLAGLTDPDIAKIRAKGDDGQLADLVFEGRRPTFIHLQGYWAQGIANDPRLDRDYLLLVQDDPSSQDYVRRDAVPAGADIESVRSRAVERSVEISAMYAAAPGRDCGPLVPGQLSVTGN